jgi:DNA-binding SARP family transcriptional activator/pimeloyl-ACP methyl ester carboxylesterase
VPIAENPLASPRRLHIYLLGQFEVRLDGKLVVDKTWPRARAKALLKLLALQAGRGLHRERILDLLWPDLSVPAANANLRKTLYHVRVAFRTAGGDDPIEVRADGIVSLTRDVCIDVDEFRKLARRARVGGESVVLYEGALSIYTGQLLPDDLYEEWSVGVRQELHALRGRLILELAAAYCRLGQPVPAIERLSALVADDPLNEAAHRGLIEAYALNGNQDRAVRQYQTLRSLLRDELSTSPSELTEHLMRDIRSGQLKTKRNPPATVREDGVPPVRYARTVDGVDIACWSIGAGPVLIDTFSMPHSHIALEWEMLECRSWYQCLARQYTYVRYDSRGSGLSETATAPDFTIDNLVLDLEAVVDQLRLQKFALLGQFHQGPAAIAYAARHPEQVSHLILWCTYARGRDFYLPEQVPAMRQVVENDYDLYVRTSASTHVGWAGNDDLLRRFAAFFYKTTRPDIALAAIDAVINYDVSELVPLLRTPTLIIHYTEPPWLSVENAKRLHSSIANSQLALLDGYSAVPWLNPNPEVAARVLQGFLDRPPMDAEADRAVVTRGERS